jgi:hypothetical protein
MCRRNPRPEDSPNGHPGCIPSPEPFGPARPAPGAGTPTAPAHGQPQPIPAPRNPTLWVQGPITGRSRGDRTLGLRPRPRSLALFGPRHDPKKQPYRARYGRREGRKLFPESFLRSTLRAPSGEGIISGPPPSLTRHAARLFLVDFLRRRHHSQYKTLEPLSRLSDLRGYGRPQERPSHEAPAGSSRASGAPPKGCSYRTCLRSERPASCLSEIGSLGAN